MAKKNDRHPVSPFHLLTGRIREAAKDLKEGRRRREEEAGMYDESERKKKQMPKR